jgi:DNA-binding NarL/FixJ family response regulator
VRFFAKTPFKDDDLSGATPGQTENLELLAAGYAYKQIADKLGITMNGVPSYVRKIYEKLQVPSRMEAVVKFLKC